MVDKAMDYLANFQKHDDLIPSAAGLGFALGVAKSTIYKWAEVHPEFSDTLELINQAQEKFLLRGGLSGDFNATIAKLALANHAYSDKVENRTDITTKGDKIQSISPHSFVGED
jgi:hypothetical protein